MFTFLYSIAHLKKQSWEGVERPTLVEGTCGFHARALGGAALPLLSQFAADHQSLMKAPT
jgi:hypothetical protein